jgi:hypothetical protein
MARSVGKIAITTVIWQKTPMSMQVGQQDGFQCEAPPTPVNRPGVAGSHPNSSQNRSKTAFWIGAFRQSKEALHPAESVIRPILIARRQGTGKVLA